MGATPEPTTRRRARSPGSDGLGWRLRIARESTNIGLRELARRIGVSPSLISQIETGKSEPSVSTLMAIVTELGLPLSEIVFDSGETLRAMERRDSAAASPGSEQSQGAESSSIPVSVALRMGGAQQPPWESGRDDVTTPVQRSFNRRAIDLESGVHWERLTAAPDHNVDFLQIRYEPGGASTPSEALMRHNGREYGYVLAGRLQVMIGFDSYELSPGDSIAFDSTTPHRLAAIGDTPVDAVWIVVGRRDDLNRTST